MRDVELRTSLSAKEVGQFDFAARAAGQDVSIFERMMRGLTHPLTGVQDLMRKRMQALEGLDPFAAFDPGPGQRDYRSPEVGQRLELSAEYQRQIEQYQ